MARLWELEAMHLAEVSVAPIAPGIAAPAGPSRASTPPVASASTLAADSPPSPWLRATATRSLLPLIAESVVVIAILAYATTWLLAPHPDATLQLAETEQSESASASEADPSALVLTVLDNNGASVKPDTLRQFEPYRGINVFSVEHGVLPGTCLVVSDPNSGRFDYHCVPHGVEPILHQWVGERFAEWLAEGSVISFHLHGNTIDVYLHRPPAEG
ncbi:hypothetical protein ACLBXX_18745 [Microbacterium sp. C23T]